MQLRLAGIDEQRLEELQGRHEEDLDQYLQRTRPNLVARSLDNSSAVRMMRIQEALAGDTGGTIIRPYGSITLVPEAKLTKGTAGKAGNPWIVPVNPEIINLSHSSRGSGFGNCLGGPHFTELEMVWHDVFFTSCLTRLQPGISRRLSDTQASGH
jgi:hypothetical protein